MKEITKYLYKQRDGFALNLPDRIAEFGSARRHGRVFLRLHQVFPKVLCLRHHYASQVYRVTILDSGRKDVGFMI